MQNGIVPVVFARLIVVIARLFRLLSLIVILDYVCFGGYAVANAATCGSHDAPVGDSTSENKPLAIRSDVLTSLETLGLTRSRIFEALQFESIPEAEGCWASAVGDFDGALLSVGALQWNYGTGSLQLLLTTYQNRLASGFSSTIASIAPIYGKLLFSDGCLRAHVTAECKAKLLEGQQPNHHLNEAFANEVNSIFSSDAMRQVQVDAFVTLLGRVRSDLDRLYPAPMHPTLRDVKWAVDMKVQQGGFPGNADISRVREALSHLNGSAREKAVSSLILWYQALCESADQGGIDLDCPYNIQVWTRQLKLLAVADDADQRDQIELAYFTFLRSRTAVGKSGYWQALAFQRRARIALGVGSVGGRKLESSPDY